MRSTINEVSSRTGWRMLQANQRRADCDLLDPALWDVIDAPDHLPTGGMGSDVTDYGTFVMVNLSGEAMRPGWY